MSGDATNLERAIGQTVAWFAMHGYPLTSFELWKWLLCPDRAYRLEEVDAALEGSAWLRERLAYGSGFIALNNGQPLASLVADRQARFLDAARKFAKLKRATHFFALLPSVRGVAACNTLAWHHTDAQSDVDLFILVEPGTVWATRLLLVAPFALLGKRPSRDAVAQDPFCFSFFLSHEARDIAPLALPDADPYLALWTHALTPVLERKGAFSAFGASNGWTRAYLPNAFAAGAHPELAPARTPPACVPLASAFERLARRVQERRLPPRLQALANRDSCVVVRDDMLKFHENDRREDYREKWKKLCATL